MRTFVQLAAIALAIMVLGAGSLQARPPMILLNGGGIVQNNNSGGGELLAIGGFTARSTGQIEEGIWHARGQIQAKNTLASDPLTTLASLHGKVVCIANLGNGFDFGGIEGTDVYEVRFKITHVGGSVNPLNVGDYGSLFVQDNGTPGTLDMADESFAMPLQPLCGIDGPFGLEPVLAGNFTDHTR